MSTSTINFSRLKRRRSLTGHLSDNDDLSSSAESLLSIDDLEEQPTDSFTAVKMSEPVKAMVKHVVHPLLIADLEDVSQPRWAGSWSNVASHLSSIDSDFLLVTFEFPTTYLDPETACQWQICHQQPLACQLSFHSEKYLDEPVTVVRVYQSCQCHPANSVKVPFIHRLISDFIAKIATDMETLKIARSVSNAASRQQCFLELVKNPSQRAQYEEMLVASGDSSLLDELLDYEILDANETRAPKLQLLRLRKPKLDAHYDFLDRKNRPPLTNGYLVQFCTYMDYRLKNLNSLCVMCGRRTLEATQKASSKPMLCDSYECFSNAMDSKFRSDPLPPSIFSIEIADFLFLLVASAIRSTRHELILDPYPTLINPYNTSTNLIDQNGDKTENIELLRTLINSLVSMESITQYEVVRISLRSTMELKHPWAFSFFHWLMGTNRYHFALIPEGNRLKEIETTQQYFIKHEDIVKHVNFKKQRAQYGSIFAFHGSPQENWHSILRSGLRIGHGAYLLHGAAYGTGIYVSPQFHFAYGYARAGGDPYRSRDYGSYTEEEKRNSPLQNPSWSCIALCEIINTPSAYTKHSSQIYTIQDPNLICTRFVFFFSRGAGSTSLDVEPSGQAANIRELIKTLNGIAC